MWIPSRRSVTLLALALVPATGAAQQAPASADDLVARGRAALTAGDLPAAGELFGRATQADPESVVAWLGASWVAERQGDPLGALGLARRAVAAGPENAATHLAVGRLLATLGHTEAALAALAESRRLAPSETVADRLAAILLRDTGRGDEAAKLLEDALVRAADPPAVVSEELAGLHLAAGKPERAVAVSAMALERFPHRAELHLAHGLALAAVADGKSPSTADKESLVAAVAALERALDLGLSQPTRAHLALADALTALERPGDAVIQLEAAADLDPDSAETFYRLGAARRRAGNAGGAREALERFQELSRAADRADHDEKKRGATLNEAQELVAAGRPEEALAQLDALLAANPGAPRVVSLKAKVLFSVGRKEEALEVIDQARAGAPGLIEPHMLAGMFLMDLGRAEAAETALAQVLALEPALADAHALLGSLTASTDRPDEAVEHFARAVALGAEGVALRLRYAEVLHTLGRIKESKRQLEVYRTLLEDAVAQESGLDGESKGPQPRLP